MEKGRATGQINVECYAGHRAEETPRRFLMGDQTFEITQVLDCWLGPDHRYFKVQTDDGGIYILRHDLEHDLWELTLFSRSEALRHGESLTYLRPEKPQ
jgi:hypothetical protein